jgi:RHS repeat-associated protein
MRPIPAFNLKFITAVGCLLSAAVVFANSLTDYGSLPVVAKPPQDQVDANQKLDFHTDRYTGRFAYSIPIVVPPARGGSQPRIALEYNSANKNGWCGVGWELEMGYIQRETRKGVPVSGNAYSDNFGFVFSFGGHSGRLINVGGSNYCAQINSDFLKFAYSNGWWIVTDKGGAKFNFGETTTSRITNSFGTFKWAMSSIRDANGNKSLLSYTNDLSQLYLKEIDYNGNDNSPAISTNCAVVFDLISTNRYDTNSTVIAGSEIQTRKLLGGVRVFSSNQLVRRYALTYITSSSTDRSLLQKVTEFGSDNTSTLPAHTFTYSQQDPSFQPAVAWSVIPEIGSGGGTVHGSTPGTPYVQLVDINGDGLPDWVTVKDAAPFTYYLVQLNTGSGFTSTQYAWGTLANEGGDPAIIWNTVDSTFANGDGSVSSVCELADVNGDSLPDRVMRQYTTGTGHFNHLQVQTNTASGFSSLLSLGGLAGLDLTYETASTTTSDGEASKSLLVDLNGDGLPDHVMPGSFNGQFDVQLNLGGSFASAIAWTNTLADAGTSYPYSPRDRSAADLGTTISHVYAELLDMNGDGLPDRVLTSGVQLNNGVRAFGPYQTSWNYSGDPEVINVSLGAYTTKLIDMNGDGLPDFVNSNGDGSYTVYFNTGRGFNGSGVLWTGVNTNTDGFGGWNHLQAWDSYGTKITFIDMNGDGLLDRVERNYSGPGSILVQLATGPFPDLLTTANNGIGGSVNVTYTNSATFNNSDGSRPRLPFPVYAVTSVTENDGRGNSATTTYDYSAGLYDTTYREFRGFGVVTETDPLNAYTITWFHQGGGTNGVALGEFSDDLAKAGMSYRVEQYGNDSKLYTRTLNKVDEVNLHTNGVFFPFIRQTITEEFEGNAGATQYRAAAVGYAYNAISNNLASSTGNLIGQTNYGEVISIVISNHTFVTTNTTAPVYRQFTYATIPSNPDIIDRVAVATVSADSSGTVILRQTTNSYFDVTGDLKTKSDLICPGTYATTALAYDNYGNVVASTDPVGIVVTTDFDAATATYPTRRYTGNLSDNLIEYNLYDSRSGAILAATNMAGLVTSNAYDVFFRLTNSVISTNQYGPPVLWRKRYQYVLGGITGAFNSSNYVRLQLNDPADTVNGYHETYTYFDGLSRVIQTRDEAETGQYRVVDIAYDDRGAVFLQNYPIFASGSGYGRPSGTRTNIYTKFDAVGRPSQIIPCASASFNSSGNPGTPTTLSGDSGSPVGATSFAYKDSTNPWAFIVTNALGKVHSYYQDAFGRTNRIVEVTSQGNFTSWLGYNQVGDLTNLTDSASNQIAFFYNLLGQRVAEADPDRGFWQFGLDAAGRLKVQTDAKNQQLKFFYDDPAGRLTRREGWNASGQLVSVMTNKYDSGDAGYAVYPGQLFAVFDDEGWQKNSNDVRGRTLKSVRYLSKNGKTYTNQFTFDDADRVSSIIYPNGGPTITNIYDTGENLTKVQRVDTGGTNIVYYTAQGFDELSRVTGVNFGNGATTTLGYYRASKRLNQIATTIPGGTTIQSFTNRYDAEGNIIAIQDTVSAHTGGASATISSAAYDDLNRLTSAVWAGYGSQSYAFDSVGNILTNTESGNLPYKYYSLRPHSVTNANGVWFTYDRNGNVVFRSGQRLDYDVNNRLFRVAATNGSTTTFGYAGDGTRLWELTGTNSLQVWIGDIYEERDGKVLYHIAASGRRVCTFEPAAGGITGYNSLTQEFYYYHPDYLTSSSLLTERNGTQVQHYEYSAFGQSRYTQSTNAFHVSRRFTGQVLDEGTGLYYYNFRYYDPLLARFVQPDDVIPDLLNPQTYNRYAYCVNNPLRFTDPSGHAGKEAADWWQAKVNVAAQAYSAGPQHWIWNGTVGTLNSLVGGIADPLRFGSDAGRISAEGGTAGQIAIAAVTEVSRAAAIVPVGAGIGKVTGTAAERLAGSLVRAGEKEAAAEVAGATVARTGPKGVDPAHHNANVTIRDANGKIIEHTRVVSGNMTVEEQALGFPKNTLASHTENRAVRQTALQEGQSMTITGQRPPCPTCKGAMNKAAAETGAKIKYQWRSGGKTQTWQAKTPRAN